VADVLLQLVLLIFLPVVMGMFMTAKFDLLSGEQILKYQKSTQLMLYAVTITIVIESWDVMQAGLVDALPCLYFSVWPTFRSVLPYPAFLGSSQ
jgi:hypothetical protein